MGLLCKTYPVCFPHELLGHERNDIGGVLLSIAIMEEIGKREQEEIEHSKTPVGRAQSAQRSRFGKFK